MANLGRQGRSRPHRDQPIATRVADLTWRLLGLAATAAASGVVDSLVIRTIAQGLIITAVTMAPQRRPGDATSPRAQARPPQDPMLSRPAHDHRTTDFTGPGFTGPGYTGPGYTGPAATGPEISGPEAPQAEADTPPWGTPPQDRQLPIPAPRTPQEQRMTVYAVYTCTGRVQVNAYELQLGTRPGPTRAPSP